MTLAEALGYTKEEIIGGPVFDLYTNDSAEYAKSIVFPSFVKTGIIKDSENSERLSSHLHFLKKIRDDKGYWNHIESCISDHFEADFSHSICPDWDRQLGIE